MNSRMKSVKVIFALLASVVWVTHSQAQQARRGAAIQLPDGAGRDVTQKVCGSTCHGPDIVAGTGRTRNQFDWSCQFHGCARRQSDRHGIAANR